MRKVGAGLMHTACAEARIRAHTSHGAAVRTLVEMGIPLNTAARYVLAYLRSTRTWRIGP